MTPTADLAKLSKAQLVERVIQLEHDLERSQATINWNPLGWESQLRERITFTLLSLGNSPAKAKLEGQVLFDYIVGTDDKGRIG